MNRVILRPDDDSDNDSGNDSDDEHVDPYDRVALNAVPCCVWTVTEELILATMKALGEPGDSYVNGSQVWLVDDGPNGLTVEWRLHPVPNYSRPRGFTTASIFGVIASAIEQGHDTLDPRLAWDGLEVFPAYIDDIDPDVLHKWASETLGIPATSFGRVDHDAIADAWEQSDRAVSITSELLQQLQSAD